MVLIMFNQSFSLLPTPEEILVGIIKAQIENIHHEYEDVEDFRTLIEDLNKVWTTIFSLAKSVDIKKPLTTNILSDPKNDFVKIILYIYSMQTFIFKEMN